MHSGKAFEGMATKVRSGEGIQTQTFKGWEVQSNSPINIKLHSTNTHDRDILAYERKLKSFIAYYTLKYKFWINKRMEENCLLRIFQIFSFAIYENGFLLSSLLKWCNFRYVLFSDLSCYMHCYLLDLPLFLI